MEERRAKRCDGPSRGAADALCVGAGGLQRLGLSMASVVFITGIPDVLAYAARLLRKKAQEGDRLAVLGSAAVLNRLDQRLWEEPVGDFTPHLRHPQGAPLPATGRRTRIWLLDAPEPSLPWSSAVNLGIDPELLTGFERVADLVGTAPEDAAAGRARWRQYTALGWQVQHHPLA
ncbi:MAG: DNA polymerase III subunit chi [Ideonella sp. MAG2]|nr:MAG: DNA polymerase III subunit chi [Ideonella sp. MAG2]